MLRAYKNEVCPEILPRNAQGCHYSGSEMKAEGLSGLKAYDRTIGENSTMLRADRKQGLFVTHTTTLFHVPRDVASSRSRISCDEGL